MSPNLRYINQSAPFWDWIASFEQSAADHPFFGGPGGHHDPRSGDERPPHPPHPPHHHHHNHQHQQHHSGPAAPWAGPWGAWSINPWARGPAPPTAGGWGHHGSELPHRGGPPPHYYDSQHQGEQSADEKMKDGEDAVEGGEAVAQDAANEQGAAAADGAVPDPPEEAHGASDRDARRWARQSRRCERRSRHCGPSSRGHHGGPFGGRGGWGGMGGRGGGFRMLSELFGQGPGGSEHDADAGADWKPEADAFDTESSYVVHVSLPGAHKEDIGVTWDAEKSELSITGVVHRPGDEAFLKTLALDERKTGAFERKVRLGTRAIPAHVDVEGITAKLENGILIVDVPKLNGEFVDVRKVDIE